MRNGGGRMKELMGAITVAQRVIRPENGIRLQPSDKIWFRTTPHSGASAAVELAFAHRVSFGGC